MTGRSRWRLTAGIIGTALAAALAVSGCGSGGRDSSAPTSAGRPEGPADAQATAGGTATAGGAGPAQGNTPAKAPDKVVPEDRSIIYNGTITVRVSDVDAAANAAATVATGAGGFIGGDNRTSNATRSEARLVLRVPSDRFTAVVGELGKLGKELRREVSTQDVTEQVVDLNARIATTTASVDRVRALLSRAASVSEIVSLEAEIARREAELESLKARQRKLTDLAALSTITAVLLGQDAQAEEKPASGFLAGLKGGWDAFLTSMQVLLTVLGAVLPWFVALGLPVALLVWLLRRAAARRGVPAPPAPEQ